MKKTKQNEERMTRQDKTKREETSDEREGRNTRREKMTEDQEKMKLNCLIDCLPSVN